MKNTEPGLSVKLLEKARGTIEVARSLASDNKSKIRFALQGVPIFLCLAGLTFKGKTIEVLDKVAYVQSSIAGVFDSDDDTEVSLREIPDEPSFDLPELDVVEVPEAEEEIEEEVPPPSALLIEQHNNTSIPCVGERSVYNITCYPRNIRSIRRFPSSSRDRVNGRWYRDGNSCRWYEDGFHMSRSQVNYVLRTGYDPQSGVGFKDYVESRLVDVDFFNETYRVDPIMRSVLYEVEQSLIEQGVSYRIGNLPRGKGYEWRAIDRTNKNLTNHGLGTAIDIDPGNNCYTNRDACTGGNPVIPVYCHTDFDNSATAADVAATNYSAPDETIYLQTMWDANLRVPFEWGQGRSGNSIYSNYTFDQYYETLLGDPHDNVPSNDSGILADWMHVDLSIDPFGRIRNRHVNRNGETLSIYH